MRTDQIQHQVNVHERERHTKQLKNIDQGDEAVEPDKVSYGLMKKKENDDVDVKFGKGWLLLYRYIEILALFFYHSWRQR